MPDTTIVVVEDDDGIRTSLATALEAEGYRVVGLADGRQLPQHLSTAELLVVDVELPCGPSGLELTRMARTQLDLPVIILTASDGLESTGAGYRAGADHYVTKPFSMTELVWRIDALLRRAGRGQHGVMQIGDLMLDPDNHVAACGDLELVLTRGEFALLQALARHKGRVLSKLQLLDIVWGHTGYDPNLVEAMVGRLRRKLQPCQRAAIETVRGIGYRLTE